MTGGQSRIAANNFLFSATDKLKRPVMEFLGCTEEAATYVLEHTGGNLKEIADIRNTLYDNWSTFVRAGKAFLFVRAVNPVNNGACVVLFVPA